MTSILEKYMTLLYVGGLAGAGYGCSPSGWMHDFNFEEWFRSMFVPAVAALVKPVVLIFDGHNSHMTYKTIKLALDNGIVLLCLIPHASHRLQPLDVGFFQPFKRIWRAKLKSWAKGLKHQAITKEIFPSVLKEAWKEVDRKQVTGGFLGENGVKVA